MGSHAALAERHIMDGLQRAFQGIKNCTLDLTGSPPMNKLVGKTKENWDLTDRVSDQMKKRSLCFRVSKVESETLWLIWLELLFCSMALWFCHPPWKYKNRQTQRWDSWVLMQVTVPNQDRAPFVEWEGSSIGHTAPTIKLDPNWLSTPTYILNFHPL